MANPPIDRSTLPTANTVIEHEAILWVTCADCHHPSKPDLAAIARRGLGDVPLVEVRFVCSVCGSRRSHPRLSSVVAENYMRRG